MNYLLLKDHLLEIAVLFRQVHFGGGTKDVIPEKFIVSKNPPYHKGHFYIKDSTEGNAENIKKSVVHIRKVERKQTILQTVQQKGSVSVKDIQRLIPGYSEKTIQRELLALVAEGKLKKRGERRWSTYVPSDKV